MGTESRNTRRRGDALTESIYTATIELMQKVGYSNLTFQQIAQAAKTSRTVMYRRWTTPFDLIREIMVDKMEALGGDLTDRMEDSGSLRGDLLQLLTLYERFLVAVGPEIINAILFEMGQGNPKIVGIESNATAKNSAVMGKVLGRAKARGEAVKAVSPATLTLPFDLLRTENLLRRGKVEEGRKERLVDEILLPVFRA